MHSNDRAYSAGSTMLLSPVHYLSTFNFAKFVGYSTVCKLRMSKCFIFIIQNKDTYPHELMKMNISKYSSFKTDPSKRHIN